MPWPIKTCQREELSIVSIEQTRRRWPTHIALLPIKTAVDAVNADATTDPNTTEPTDTSVNAVGQPKPPAIKAAEPGSEPPPFNQPVWVPCFKHRKQPKQTDMD